ncbi:SDR family NAD(P)-dependent oxidoreductase [Candidatus Woesearchaeota archaeon]|nr:SDR family NAD(P)-dependent oxidoreductase [Candidatus Woesearchaeota archaeon]
MSFFRGKNALVTGGAGAIGSNLSKELIKKGCKTVIVDNLSSGFKENIPGGCEFIQGDIRDENVLKQAFDRSPNIIFHLAANFANQNSVDHPELDLMVNGIGTLKLLKFSKDRGVEKFIFSSSSCVYGNKSGSLNEEGIPGRLDTPYAFSKFLGEQYVNFFNKHFGLKTVILRYFNSYGPNEYPGKYRNVIPNFICAALKGEPLAITGTGDETRDFTFVGDIVTGTLLAAEEKSANGEVFNIGSGKETQIKFLANKINGVAGNVAGIKYTERRQWDHISRRLASLEKSRKILKYAPQVGLDKGLKITIEWLKDNVKL